MDKQQNQGNYQKSNEDESQNTKTYNKAQKCQDIIKISCVKLYSAMKFSAQFFKKKIEKIRKPQKGIQLQEHQLTEQSKEAIPGREFQMNIQDLTMNLEENFVDQDNNSNNDTDNRENDQDEQNNSFQNQSQMSIQNKKQSNLSSSGKKSNNSSNNSKSNSNSKTKNQFQDLNTYSFHTDYTEKEQNEYL
ncbi:hypothetical protein PPERSA_01825 [Pseudocohnilembus persalinus]|uniref:Uncharacterized protein n=1 Tax=Pseudocohnilembus persalinus TaxID=266149 RepID=A0A0V0QKJ3_PSEPJ|nr:hypothetical protein PPERSA_01825 [Pseudocohnilembus persalinus]|eukprot:KRX02708.1 hypothetical protein PPERSA_01825 [Pseudocohnilembus persalinus]